MNFQVKYTSPFEKDLSKLTKRNKEVLKTFEEVVNTLSTDPYNVCRQCDIRKLIDVSFGEGQWRIRIDDYRIRYDIDENIVILYSFKHRRDSYKN